MIGLDFGMEQPLECPEGNAGDVAFIKATRSIGSRDVVEEYIVTPYFLKRIEFYKFIYLNK
jgi:hypothetical protein